MRLQDVSWTDEQTIDSRCSYSSVLAGFTRSDAALRVAAYLGGGWRLFLAAYLVPWPVRDLVYDVCARYRYRLFGKYDSCRLPSPATRARFLD